MKINCIYWYVLIPFLFGFISCSDDETIDCTASIQEVTSQLEENSMLQTIDLRGDSYHLEFERGSVEIPKYQLADYTYDTANWETTLSFVNGRSFTVPTVGENIDKFITSVTVNPSNYNPLAAEVLVDLPTLGIMKVIVHTKPGNKAPDVTHNFSSIERSQRLQVLGLYPDYENQVTLIYADKEGNERSRSELSIKTLLPETIHLPDEINVTALQNDKYQPGMTLVNSWGVDMLDTSVPYMFDRDGEIRWVLDWDNHPVLAHCRIDCGLTRMKNGHYLTGDANTDAFLELDALGNIVNQWSLKEKGYFFHHCATESADGNFVATVSKINAKLINSSHSREQDVVVEFDPLHGNIVHEFDFVNMLDSARYDLNGAADDHFPSYQTQSNWMHNNGILKIGDSYLGTARYQGIFRYDSNGKVKWVISAHDYWRPLFKKLLLQPLHADGTPITDPEVISGHKTCKDFEWPWGCHCCVQLPNGHYMAFDNGYGRQYKAISPTYVPYSRAVEYEVDEQKRTVRQVWQYGTERGRAFFSPLASSVEYLTGTGNILIGSADYNILSTGRPGARICEIDPTTNEVIFETELVGGNFHRVLRLPLYPEKL